MNGLINQHLIELLALFIASVSYIIIHFAVGYSAVVISGQKKGIIRQCVQGFFVVASFIIAMIIACNGAVRYYHVITYVVMLTLFVRVGKLVASKIRLQTVKAERKKIISSDKN